MEGHIQAPGASSVRKTLWVRDVSQEGPAQSPGAELPVPGWIFCLDGAESWCGSSSIRTVSIFHWLLRLDCLFVFRHCKETYLMLFNLCLASLEMFKVFGREKCLFLLGR